MLCVCVCVCVSLPDRPFMLSSRMSYAQMGTFSLAAAPYSLKLLWSPIVDCLYSERMGRRKTWIVPIQVRVQQYTQIGIRE